jgi:hypothetical protein
MNLAVFKNNHMVVFGNKYFVANAPVISIGNYGTKATPVFGPNKLEPKDRLPAPKLDGKIRTVPPFTIDSTKTKKNDFTTAVSASLKVIGFSGSVGNVYDALVENRVQLVELFVEENDMRRAANDSPMHLGNLKNCGASGRLVHRTIVAMEATFATSFTSATKYEVSINAGILSVNASGGSTVAGKTTVTLSPGTTIGYLLLNPIWDKNKSKIEETRVDEWGIN